MAKIFEMCILFNTLLIESLMAMFAVVSTSIVRKLYVL